MRLTTKSQVTVPKRVRDVLGVGPGSEVDFRVDGNVVTLVPAISNDVSAERAASIEAWAKRMAGTVDLGGMTTDEYIEWLRGPREDLTR